MSKGPRVFFTSDLHLGHQKVAELRGFESTYDHDVRVVANWIEAVGPKDQVWVLGDIAVGNPVLALRILAQLPGEKHLIWGNHDQGHPMHRNAHRKAAQYLGVFASAAQSARRRINGESVLLSHFPYVGDTAGRDRDRYIEWRLAVDSQPADQIAPIIHGHTHGPERATWAHQDAFVGGFEDVGRQIHVGLDAWGLRPVALETVAELLDEGR